MLPTKTSIRTYTHYISYGAKKITLRGLKSILTW